MIYFKMTADVTRDLFKQYVSAMIHLKPVGLLRSFIRNHEVHALSSYLYITTNNILGS